jgi:hypothetical protein
MVSDFHPLLGDRIPLKRAASLKAAVWTDEWKGIDCKSGLGAEMGRQLMSLEAGQSYGAWEKE